MKIKIDITMQFIHKLIFLKICAFLLPEILFIFLLSQTHTHNLKKYFETNTILYSFSRAKLKLDIQLHSMYVYAQEHECVLYARREKKAEVEEEAP